jgi:hypothetical protein
MSPLRASNYRISEHNSSYGCDNCCSMLLRIVNVVLQHSAALSVVVQYMQHYLMYLQPVCARASVLVDVSAKAAYTTAQDLVKQQLLIHDTAVAPTDELRPYSSTHQQCCASATALQLLVPSIIHCACGMTLVQAAQQLLPGAIAGVAQRGMQQANCRHSWHSLYASLLLHSAAITTHTLLYSTTTAGARGAHMLHIDFI